VELGVLVQQRLATGGAVVGAGRTEDPAFDPGLTGAVGELHRSPPVDVVGQLRIQVAQGVVGQRRQVAYGVDPLQVGHLDVAQVLDDLGHRSDGALVTEGAPSVQVGVIADHLVSFPQQQPCQHHADVAPMAGHQHTHQIT
jgi:hypothetical protein